MLSVSDLLTAGDEKLESGETDKAHAYFSEASLLAVEGPDKVQAELQAGFALRRSWYYISACNAFRAAYRYADNDLQRGHILREWGQVHLDQREADKALGLFEESLNLIALACRGMQVDDKARLEHAITLSYIGRAHLAHGDRVTALGYLCTADLCLRGSQSELDNLIWQMRASQPHWRLRHVWRAWRLARKASRRMQVARVTLSPRLDRAFAFEARK